MKNPFLTVGAALILAGCTDSCSVNKKNDVPVDVVETIVSMDTSKVSIENPEISSETLSMPVQNETSVVIGGMNFSKETLNDLVTIQLDTPFNAAIDSNFDSMYFFCSLYCSEIVDNLDEDTLSRVEKYLTDFTNLLDLGGDQEFQKLYGKAFSNPAIRSDLISYVEGHGYKDIDYKTVELVAFRHSDSNVRNIMKTVNRLLKQKAEG